MYNTLPFGPLSLPTGPVFALLAAFLALEVAGRVGRRFGLHHDVVWNAGLLALLAGLIVARLWAIIQFWPVYRAEPLLAFSLRPSGFALWPGLIAALIAGYVWLLYRALDPARVLASLLVGMAAGGILLNVSAWLTGSALGLPSDWPWATRHFLEHLHPVGLYRALGLVIVVMVAWKTVIAQRPWRTTWITVMGYAVVHLVSDAFLSEPEVVGLVRRSQVIALVVALGAALALARESRSAQLALNTEPIVAAQSTPEPTP